MYFYVIFIFPEHFMQGVRHQGREGIIAFWRENFYCNTVTNKKFITMKSMQSIGFENMMGIDVRIN